jgi:hypothetical protein
MTIKMDDDDPVLTAERLARYQVPAAPPGFADDVAARLAARSVPARRWPFIAGGLAAAALVAIVLARHRGSLAAAGERSVAARETVGLGTRAVAVAEAGSQLQWRIGDDGEAAIEQRAGSVFYRVEPGGAFAVRTPAGVVTVTGTCFSVEVKDMKSKRDMAIGAALGAVVTATIVVVYEGSVSLAGSNGAMRVAAGESAVIEPGAPPRARTTSAVAADPALASANARIAQLERQLREARHETDSSESGPFMINGNDPGRYIAPSQATLAELAARCGVAYDQPPFADAAPTLVDAKLAIDNGVSEAERTAINAAYRKVHDRDLELLRHLYMELTGADADAAAALSVEALEAEIEHKSPPGEELAARTRYARERAGLDPMPSAAELAARPAIERMLRLRASLGNDAEAAAAGVVGAERARALRSDGGKGVGWQNTASDYGGCDENK